MAGCIGSSGTKEASFQIPPPDTLEFVANEPANAIVAVNTTAASDWDALEMKVNQTGVRFRLNGIPNSIRGTPASEAVWTDLAPVSDKIERGEFIGLCVQGRGNVTSIPVRVELRDAIASKYLGEWKFAELVPCVQVAVANTSASGAQVASGPAPLVGFAVNQGLDRLDVISVQGSVDWNRLEVKANQAAIRVNLNSIATSSEGKTLGKDGWYSVSAGSDRVEVGDFLDFCASAATWGTSGAASTEVQIREAANFNLVGTWSFSDIGVC